MAKIHRQIEDGQFPGVAPTDFYPLVFADKVHISQEGSYLVDCTWLAAMYGQSPVDKLLPVKLALEVVYVREANFWSDLRILVRTTVVIVLIVCGRRRFRDPPEMRKVPRVVPARRPGPPDAPRLVQTAGGPGAGADGEETVAGTRTENEVLPARLGA